MKRMSTGQFIATPEGEKTPKMLEVEERLGRTLEKDFQEYYIEKRWGQKRLANRWQVQRALIFGTNLRGGRRSWSQMLNLSVRREDGKVASRKAESISQSKCEICNEYEIALDNAHWVSDRDGGSSASNNILHLCPNCHRKLDRHNSAITEKARQILLFREARRILETRKDTEAKQRKLLQICEGIINRKPI